MKRCRMVFLLVVCLSLVQATLAQTSTASALPRLVRFGGTVKGPDGNPLAGVAGITFALYSEQTGGAPLWMETQNVTADSNGRYTALLGASRPDGLPAELFTSEQAHWVGVQVQGQPEQPRVMLVSAPYALKAGDAETIGGLPPSAFVLAAPSAGPAAPGSAASPASDAIPADDPAAVTGSGKADYIPLWSTATKLGSSVLFQSGTGATADIGINTATPASTLDVNGTTTLGGTTTLPATGTATATAGNNSEPLILAASVFNSGTSAAVAQTFQLQAEPVGNDSATPSGALSLLYGSGAGAPAETGLKIAGNGQIAFATGQAFPGVAQLNAANVFTANQTVNGNVSASQFVSTAATGTAPLQVASTTQVANLNASLLGGMAASSFQPAGSYATLGANTFSGNQNITGNLSTTGAITTGAGSTFSGLTMPAMSAATSSKGQISHSLNLTASSYDSSTSAAVNENFKWEAEPTGNDTTTPGATLNLLFNSGSNSAAETGLKLASNGQITFAVGQTFPGTTPAGVVGVNPLQVALLKWFQAYQSATFSLGGFPSAIAFDGVDIWVTGYGSGNVTKLLAATGAVVGTYAVGSGPNGVAFDGANIWVSNYGSGNVTKLVAATGVVVGTYPAGANPSAVAFDGTNIWVANVGSSNVTKLLAATGAVVGTYPAGSAPSGVAFDGTNIWVTNENSATVTKLLAATGALVGTFPVGTAPEGVAFDGANIWVANSNSNSVTKLLAATGAVVGTFPVGSLPYAVAFDGANIWVANATSNNVTKLLAATGAVVGTFPAGSLPVGIAFDGANVWVANNGSGNVSKL